MLRFEDIDLGMLVKTHQNPDRVGEVMARVGFEVHVLYGAYPFAVFTHWKNLSKGFKDGEWQDFE